MNLLHKISIIFYNIFFILPIFFVGFFASLIDGVTAAVGCIIVILELNNFLIYDASKKLVFLLDTNKKGVFGLYVIHPKKVIE
jgi:hypothetical protein